MYISSTGTALRKCLYIMLALLLSVIIAGCSLNRDTDSNNDNPNKDPEQKNNGVQEQADINLNVYFVKFNPMTHTWCGKNGWFPKLIRWPKLQLKH